MKILQKSNFQSLKQKVCSEIVVGLFLFNLKEQLFISVKGAEAPNHVLRLRSGFMLAVSFSSVISRMSLLVKMMKFKKLRRLGERDSFKR